MPRNHPAVEVYRLNVKEMERFGRKKTASGPLALGKLDRSGFGQVAFVIRQAKLFPVPS